MLKKCDSDINIGNADVSSLRFWSRGYMYIERVFRKKNYLMESGQIVIDRERAYLEGIIDDKKYKVRVKRPVAEKYKHIRMPFIIEVSGHFDKISHLEKRGLIVDMSIHKD